jgi:hypothetical protein
MGLSDEQINAALALKPATAPAPAPTAEPVKHRRRTKAEMEAFRAEEARKALEAQGQQTLPGTNGAHPPAAAPVQEAMTVAASDIGEMPAFLKRNEPEPQPAAAAEQPPAGDLPADFEQMLDELTKT